MIDFLTIILLIFGVLQIILRARNYKKDTVSTSYR